MGVVVYGVLWMDVSGGTGRPGVFDGVRRWYGELVGSLMGARDGQRRRRGEGE